MSSNDATSPTKASAIANQRALLLNAEPVIITICIMHTIAILTTVIRLVHRKYIQRLWWDDFWAAMALFCEIALFLLYMIYTSIARRVGSVTPALRLAARWTTLLSYTASLWASRLTISVTITRLLQKGRLKHVSMAASYIFSAFALTMLLQKIFFCGTNWAKQTACATPQYAGYMELTTDNIADLWLILAPAYILRKTKLRPTHQRLIAAIFTCGFFTMLASIIHSVFILLNAPQKIGFSGHIQVTIAIVVSNLLVLVTAIYRALRRRVRLDGASELGTPRRTSSTSETRDAHTVTGASSGQQPTTERSHLTLTELTDSRYTATLTHITLTEFTESRSATTHRSGMEFTTEMSAGTDLESSSAVISNTASELRTDGDVQDRELALIT